jgi:hypothetical protein
MAKASKAVVAQRVEEVLRIRLDGAAFWDVLQYIAEKQQAGEAPWTIPEGGKPIAGRTVWWYIHKADHLLAETFRKEAGRKNLFRRHLAQRRALFAKATLAGDHRAALAALRDEAELLGLYPPKGVAVAGKNGGPIVLNVIEEVVGRPAPAALGNIVEEVVASANRTNGTLPDDPPAPGAAGLPPL